MRIKYFPGEENRLLKACHIGAQAGLTGIKTIMFRDCGKIDEKAFRLVLPEILSAFCSSFFIACLALITLIGDHLRLNHLYQSVLPVISVSSLIQQAVAIHS